MIIVTITSWVKRINNVKKVVEAIMNNTVQPDSVYLNLSRTEFDGIELPADLVEYFNSDDRLIINWVDGENTKSFKKTFPILHLLDDDDIIIECDDDILVPDTLIEFRLKDFENNGKIHPITSTQKKCWIGNQYIVGPSSLFTKRMLNNWELFVDENIIHTYNDDRTKLYIFQMNGYTTVPCTRWTDRGLKKFSYNAVCGMGESGVYPMGKQYDKVVADRVKEVTGTTIDKAFAFFCRVDFPPAVEGKHDVVIPWCHRGIASQMMTCGDRLEIEYVIASLYKYCQSWLGRIFIVGSEPPESIKDKVVHVPCDDPYTHCKDANIIHKILYAIENVPDLTEDFVKASDDQIVTKETFWEDLTPRIVRMYTDWTEQQWMKNRRLDQWHDNLWLTLHLFDLNKAYFAEPHIWAPFNKHKYVEMCNKYNWQKSRACIDNTLYYNFIDYPPIAQFDHLHLSRSQAKKMIDNWDEENILRHLSWTDSAFADKRFRTILNKIIFENA